MDKIINSKCICKKGLPWIEEEVVMLEPCEHLIHKKCIKSHICPYCKIKILNIIYKNDYKINPKLYQKCIDIMSMSNYNNGSIDYSKILLSLPDGISTMIQFPFSKGITEGKKLCENIFHMNNIKIRVHGLSKIKNGPKVYISNHTSNLDFIILFYILGCGFLASSNIKDNPIAKSITNIIPVLMIDRGKKTNTVDKMKEYVENVNSICLFVEGMMTNPNTLIHFRTGAFHIGHPIYPIILKYKNNICDMDLGKFILKLFSEQTEEVDMIILDPFYPPFNETKIELVRHEMAKIGNLLLSRVSNRDIVDTSNNK